jgi:hypothetical protein
VSQESEEEELLVMTMIRSSMEGNDYTRENNTKNLRKTLRTIYTPTVEKNRQKEAKQDQGEEEKYLNAAEEANKEG